MNAARESAPPPKPSTTTITDSGARIVRATGTVQAVRSYTVRVPQLAQNVAGRASELTLTALIPNGSAAKAGDILAQFDNTAQIDDAREAQAKLQDLEHQLEEKRAQYNSDSAKRLADINEAETEYAKAKLQLQKGEVLADLDRRKNEVKAAGSQERIGVLKAAHAHRVKAETAAVRILELKCERQKVTVERLKANIEKLVIRSPHDGMIALENVWRAGSMGPPRVGDQVWPNSPILRIFDPAVMIIETSVNEPDFSVVSPSTRARVYLDAYPDAAFDAELESASPVATSGLESPVKSFTARFRISQRDARLLPDLSASLEIHLPSAGAKL